MVDLSLQILRDHLLIKTKLQEGNLLFSCPLRLIYNFATILKT